MASTEKIGSVSITRLKEYTGTEYSDGDIENDILEIFKKGITDDQRKKILSDNPNWAVRYHLAYERANLLNWYKFKEGSKVLEVGGGCGAITEALVKNNVSVVVNELSERRATINAYRNKESKNLEITIGNLQDLKRYGEFDYVVCVGVLEYSGTFINAQDPYREFVKNLSRFLKPGGVALIAIENRLGMKYFAGAREDHSRGYFDGLNDYPKELSVKTFGKKELSGLIESTDLKVKEFFYPHPDYKLPSTVYSDSFKPGKNTSLPKASLPGPNFDQTREYLFSEQLFEQIAEKNQLFDIFANSFLVECVKCESDDEAPTSFNNAVFSTQGVNRQDQYQIRTSAFQNENDTLVFRKEALTNSSKVHIEEMKTTYGMLNNRKMNLLGVSEPINFDSESGFIDFSFIDGKSAESTLIEAITEDNYAVAKSVLEHFFKVLDELSEEGEIEPSSLEFSKYFGKSEIKSFVNGRVIHSGLLDLNLDNFIIDKKVGKWWLIDYEWRFNIALPVEYVKYRALLYFFSRHRGMIKSRSLRNSILENNVLAVPDELLNENKISLQLLNKAHAIENKYLQPTISGSKYKYDSATSYSPAEIQKFFIDDVYEKLQKNDNQMVQLQAKVDLLTTHLDNSKADYEALESHHNRIISSKAYKAASQVSKLKKAKDILRSKPSEKK